MFSNFQKFLDGPVDLDIFYGQEQSYENVSNKLERDSLVDRAYMLPSTSRDEIRSRRHASSNSRSNNSQHSEPIIVSNQSQRTQPRVPPGLSQSSGSGLRGLNGDIRSYQNTTFARESDQVLNEISECDPHQELTSAKRVKKNSHNTKD